MNRGIALRRIVLLSLLFLLAGCASKERIILLPGPDGKVGGVVVRKSGQEVELNTAYANAEIGDRSIEQKTLSAAEVNTRYADVLKARPVRPRSYDLYFISDQTKLVPESQAKLAEIKRELTALPAPELLVIGHTDRVGDTAYNDQLSRRRAEKLRDILVAIGIPRERIEVYGRGERAPAVATRDQVSEIRNRRVEIKIR